MPSLTSQLSRLEARVAEDEGDYQLALECWNRVIDTFVANGWTAVTERAIAGLVASYAGDPRAEAHFEDADRELRALPSGTPERYADHLWGELRNRRAEWHANAGRLDRAETDARGAREARRRAGDFGSAGGSGYLLAVILRQSDPGAALDVALEAIDDHRRAGSSSDDPIVAEVHFLAADLLEEAGRTGDAERHRRLATTGEVTDDDRIAALDREQEARRTGAVEADSIRRLARDEAPSVRAAVAARDDIPDDVAAMMLDDTDEVVRVAAASNPALPLQLIDPLLRRWRRHPVVRRVAASRPAPTGQLSRHSLERRRGGTSVEPWRRIHQLLRRSSVV